MAGIALVLAAGAAAAADGPMDFLFLGGGQPPRGGGTTWKVADYSAVRLVPREPGGDVNAQPVQWDPEALRAALASVFVTASTGKESPLFSTSELSELLPPLVSAFAASAPDQDMVLLSTSRRSDGIVTPPKSITARLFVAEGRLHMIVHDARADFYVPFQASQIMPDMKFGSRFADSGVLVHSPVGISRRNDWLTLKVSGASSTAGLTAPVAQELVPARAPAPAAKADAPPPAMRDNAFYEQQELRLKSLKRLHDQGLITDRDYESKYRAIIDPL